MKPSLAIVEPALNVEPSIVMLPTIAFGPVPDVAVKVLLPLMSRTQPAATPMLATVSSTLLVTVPPEPVPMYASCPLMGGEPRLQSAFVAQSPVPLAVQLFCVMAITLAAVWESRSADHERVLLAPRALSFAF